MSQFGLGTTAEIPEMPLGLSIKSHIKRPLGTFKFLEFIPLHFLMDTIITFLINIHW